jgi:hypothetical protein
MKVQLKSQYKTRVDFEIQTLKGPEKTSFEAIFKGLSRTQYQALMARADEAIKRGEDGDALVLEEVLQGWESVEDEHGQPIPFTPENQAHTWDTMPAARLAAVRTFILTATGARSGN